VIDIFLEGAVCEVGAEEVVEVSDAGAREGERPLGRRGCIGWFCRGGVGVCGECAGGEHVNIWIDGVVVECDEGGASMGSVLGQVRWVLWLGRSRN
jgi:hypothetical protein